MPKTQKAIFLISLFIFLFFGSKALAAACNLPPAWNPAGSCTLDIYYEDPTGGSNLAGCYYNTQSGASPTCPSNGTWNSACSCSGLASITCPVNVSIGPTGNCNTNGAGACKVCSKATDGAGNVGYGEQSLNIDFAAPNVSVTGAPVSWQKTDATASVSCSDVHSGCDSATYKLKTYTANPGTCPTDYSVYTLAPPQTISSHLWVCGAAKDNLGNTGFSSPVEFKVDKIKPVSQITAPPADSTQSVDFNVTVSDTDTGGSGINTAACYYRTYDSGIGWTRDWTLRTCNSNRLITVGTGKDCWTENGTCTVYVYSYDNAGNQSDTNLRSFLIRIDLTPPVITINTPTGRWYNSNPLLDVDFSDEKALDDGFYQVDSYTGTWTAIFTDNTGTSYTTDFRIADSIWNGFADGSSHTIYFKATDDAGNVTGADGSKSLVIKKDVSAPAVTVTGAPASWQSTDATASVSCTDVNSSCDSATYKLKTYTLNPVTCSTTYTDYTLTSPQTISSHLWVCGAAEDVAGNAGFSSPVEFKVDKIKPVSLIIAPEAGSTQTADFNVTVTDTDTGDSGLNTAACYYRTYDSGVGYTRAWTLRTCNANQLITVGAGKDCQTENGTCTVYVYSYDNAGNQSDWNSRSFLIRIDLTPPTITINTLSGLWYNSNPLLDVDFADEKALDDGFYQVDSYTAAWTAIFTDNTGTSYTTDFRIADSIWNGFADGSSHTIYFKATDDAGNVTGADGSKSLVIKKDVSAPAVTVTGAPVSWQNADATANLTCADSYSGCDSAAYKLKTYTTNPVTCPTSYTDYTLIPPQTISSHLWVCGAAKDLVGNTGFSLPVEFKVDKTKPVSLITAPPAGSTQTADFNVTVTDTDTGDSGLNASACYYRTYDSGVGWTRDWTLRICNSTQLITVGAGEDCQTIGGTCSVYVYSYDNAGNQSDTNLRSFTIESSEGITCSVSVPNSGLINEPILINVSGCQGTIVGVRFASDNILNGTPDGNWDPPSPNYYDWTVSSGNWDATNKTMKWSFATTGSYEVWAEIKDGAGNTRSCYDTILIQECYPGQTTTCTSPQGCTHTITCQTNGTWPACPVDTCTANTQNTIACPCPGVDGCFGNDYYDYPPYGDCNSSCSCDLGTSPGQPCAPTIYLNDSRCVGVDQCNSDAECDDGNPCTQNICNNPGAPDSFCSYPYELEGTSCGICKECDGNGNCINRADGYNTSECGAGCQRCIYGSCGDYHLACDQTGNNEASCECHSDSCIDCSNYYGEVCGYQGICHCGPLERPVWSCSNWRCTCTCQYDSSCEEGWEPDGYPEVIISPPSQEGDLGDELPYEVTIINPSEEEVTLTITASVPSGWDYWLDTLGMVEVTIGPGQSAKIPLRVKSPAEGVPSGEYIISVTAQNENFGTGYAKYEIPNQPPAKPGIPTEYLSWNHCSIQALSIPTFYWTYSDPEGDPQAGYQIRIDNDSDFSSPEPDEFTDSKDSPSHSYTPLPTPWGNWMNWNTDYWWVVKVKDNQGNWSDWSDPTQFTTPLHAGPWPEFTPSPNRVSLNQVVTFEDSSKCYTSPGNVEYNCRDLAVSYEWDFDYIEPTFTIPADSTTKGNATTAYSDLGNYKVKLRITDDIDTCYSETENLTVTLPLPEWREIPPF